MHWSLKAILLVQACLLFACGPAYDKSFYKKISGIEIPAHASVVETVDNGEFLTVTTFRVTHPELMKLIEDYAFEAVDGSYVPGFLGNPWLNGPKPEGNDLNQCLMKTSGKGKTTAVYVLDTARHLLWAEINYPDWGGN